MTKQSEIIILFDEFGTPSFHDNTTNNFFIGVCTLYVKQKEIHIFNNLDKLMGLSNSKPVKNNRIGKERAISIAENIIKQDLHMSLCYLDLSNRELYELTDTYLKFCDISRKIFRGIAKERKVAHFFHSQLLVFCLSNILTKYLSKNFSGTHHIEIFVDDWNYPVPDRNIFLEYTSERLSQALKELTLELRKEEVKITTDNIKLLKKASSKRKRMIDNLTSISSRKFVDKNNIRYDPEPLNILERELSDKCSIADITRSTINIMNTTMYENIIDTKVKDEPKIII